MALRVLLADESSTIKKVFQLALQDFAVEVTAVNIGIDVVQVAEKIKPDIIFADVLLQKKNGYEVCQELKSISHLAKIPVILIWSGFMELDKNKFKMCGADNHLEKPFDTKKLRQMVQDYVPKTKTQPLSDFMSFPKMPQFEEMPAPPPAIELGGGRAVEPQSPTTTTSSWNMDSFAPLEALPEIEATPETPAEDVEEFMQVELPAEPPRPLSKKSPVQAQIEKSILESDDDEAQWVNQSLSKYKLAPDKIKEDEPRVKFKVPEEKINPEDLVATNRKLPPIPSATTNFENNNDEEELLELDLNNDDTPPAPLAAKKEVAKSTNAPAAQSVPPQLNEKELEAIIRAQSKEVIEKVVWQIVPEMASRIIEREIERLFKERK